MTNNIRVLLVDDEASITSTLSLFLRLSGFTVEISPDGVDALQKLEAQPYDIVVLDVLMPRMDGRETLRRLRQQNIWTPVILLTQIEGTAERIMGLEEGADDYLNKPFDPHELVVRMRAILRRVEIGARASQHARRLRSGDLVLDRSSRRVWMRSVELPLTPKAVAILEYLMVHRDQLVTRDQLLDAIWGWENVVGTRVVDTRVAELRKALADSPTNPEYIETIPGQGYRFVNEVAEIT